MRRCARLVNEGSVTGSANHPGRGSRRDRSRDSHLPPRHAPHSARRAAENREERALFLRFREQGDASAFDELVRRTEARVRAVALAILRDPAAAEDVAQEAFLRAWRRASSWRGQGAVAAWLCRIAVRCAHDHIRKAARRRRLAELLLRGSPPDPEGLDAGDHAEAIRNRTELESALRNLPPSEREALILKEVAGMTYREIAGLAGLPLGTVQSRIHRARRRLAAALSSDRSPRS